MQQKEFYSNGKLLISGEYLVLHGAKALAVPLTKGQNLKVEHLHSDQEPKIFWRSMQYDQQWFEMEVSSQSFKIHHTSDIEIANRLISCLQKARELNPVFLTDSVTTKAETNLTFNREWGLGSSSTLINNIANWAGIDAYKLLELTFGGSGFDIACASAAHSVFYHKKNESIEIKNANFNPDFKNQLFFVYLGSKQDSSNEILRFETAQKYDTSFINDISDLSELMARTNDQSEFGKCMLAHEEMIASIIKQKTVKSRLFNDFEGEIKSLGAWGGDFVMVLSSMPYSEVKNYFKNKGLSVIFKFSDLIK